MAVPQIVTVTLVAAVSNGIALSQAVAGAGNLTLNGTYATAGVATLPTPRRVTAVSAGAGDTTQTITYTGTDRFGNVITEVITLNGTTAVSTNQDFKTVTRAAISAATAGNITVGTNTVGSSEWKNVSNEIAPVNIGIGVVVSGTVNYTIEYTYDDPNGIPGVFGYNGASVVPAVFAHTVLVNQTVNNDGSFAFPIWGWRLTVNSGTGSATATGRSAGIAGSSA